MHADLLDRIFEHIKPAAENARSYSITLDGGPC
jgi:hypothetical protein